MRRRAAPSSYMEEVCRLSSPKSTTLSGLASGADRRLSVPGDVTSFNSGSMRLEGPIQKISASTTGGSIGGIRDLLARLEHLAFSPRAEGGPPLVTYTTTPSEHGDVVRATEAYVEWFRRTYPAAGRADSARVPAPGAAAQGAGRSARLKHFNS